jgi:hypothetical protein
MRAVRARIIRKLAHEIYAPSVHGRDGFKRLCRSLKRNWVKGLGVALVVSFLAGCATQAIGPIQVPVAGQIKTYVTGKIPIGVLGDELTIVDRYDEKGNLIHASETSTTGTVHDALKAAAGSSGTAALVTPVITPIVNDLQGK